MGIIWTRARAIARPRPLGDPLSGAFTYSELSFNLLHESHSASNAIVTSGHVDYEPACSSLMGDSSAACATLDAGTRCQLAAQLLVNGIGWVRNSTLISLPLCAADG